MQLLSYLDQSGSTRLRRELSLEHGEKQLGRRCKIQKRNYIMNEHEILKERLKATGSGMYNGGTVTKPCSRLQARKAKAMTGDELTGSWGEIGCYPSPKKRRLTILGTLLNFIDGMTMKFDDPRLLDSHFSFLMLTCLVAVSDDDGIASTGPFDGWSLIGFLQQEAE